MRNLSDQGWVEWKPSVGRSKTSSIQLNISLRDALTQTMQEELLAGRSRLIAKLLEQYQQTALEALALANEANANHNAIHEQFQITGYPRVDILDPIKSFRHAELQIVRSTFDTLLNKNSHGSLIPGIAHDWTFDHNTLQLWIRRDVKTHTGKQLTIADIIASLERTRNQQGPLRYLYNQIENVCEAENHSIRVELTRPNSLFLFALTSPCAGITLEEAQHFSGSRKVQVGTGPFKVSNWSKEEIVLKKHHSYFGQTAVLNRLTLTHAQPGLASCIQKASSKHSSLPKQSFSYLCAQYRDGNQVSQTELKTLLDYISLSRVSFTAGIPVRGATLEPMELKNDLPPPRLKGRVVIAQPKWNVDYLLELSEWIKQHIRYTGLEVETIELEDVANPASIKEHADLLLMAEIVEQPKCYGLYEWLLTSTCPRFLYTEKQFSRYLDNISQATEHLEPCDRLTEIEQTIVKEKLYTPLFLGTSFQLKNSELSGTHVDSLGYNAFHKLWVK